ELPRGRHDLPRRPPPLARGRHRRRRAGLGPGAQRRVAGRAHRRRALRRAARRAAQCARRRRPHPLRAPPRRPALQLLAGRRASPRALATHDAGRLPLRRPRLGAAARRRRARRGRGRELGVVRRRRAFPRPPARPRAALARRRGRDGRARVRPRYPGVGARRLHAARGQEPDRLDRRGHRLRRHRPGPRLAHHVRLPARDAPLEARAARRRGRGRLRGRRDRRVGLRRPRPHRGLGARLRRPQPRLPHHQGVPAAPGRDAGAPRRARRRRHRRPPRVAPGADALAVDARRHRAPGRGPAVLRPRRLPRGRPHRARALRAHREPLAELPRLDAPPPPARRAHRRRHAPRGAHPRTRLGAARAAGRAGPGFGRRGRRRPRQRRRVLPRHRRLHPALDVPARRAGPRGGPGARGAAHRAGAVRRDGARGPAVLRDLRRRHARPLLRRRPAGRHPGPDADDRLRRLRDRADPGLQRDHGPRLARPRRDLRRGQHPRRRGVRADVAHRRARRAPPPGLRGLRGRGPRPRRPRDHDGAAARDPRRQQRRAAHGRDAHPLPRAVRRDRGDGAAVRHAPVPPAAGRGVVDGRVRRPRRARAVGLDRAVLAVPEPVGRRDLPAGAGHDLDPRRPRPPRPRPQGRGAAARAGPPRRVLREHRGRPRRRRRQRPARVPVGAGVRVLLAPGGV
ncbi:MAG: Prolyl endopeptidase, partial [uncultured Actinomycetospora sp.]